MHFMNTLKALYVKYSVIISVYVTSLLLNKFCSKILLPSHSTNKRSNETDQNLLKKLS